MQNTENPSGKIVLEAGHGEFKLFDIRYVGKLRKRAKNALWLGILTPALDKFVTTAFCFWHISKTSLQRGKIILLATKVTEIYT